MYFTIYEQTIYKLNILIFISFNDDETLENIESKIRGKSLSSARSTVTFSALLSQLYSEHSRSSRTI